MPPQLEIATTWSSSRGADIPVPLVMSTDAGVMDIHSSPSSRTTRVLTSKRTPKATDLLKPEVVPGSHEKTSHPGRCVKLLSKVPCAVKEARCSAKLPQPDIPIISERRRSSGHIVISGSQRPQLFLNPRTKDGGGFNSKPQPSVDLKALAAKDTTQGTMPGIQVLQHVSDELQTIRALESDISAGFQSNAPPIAVDDCTGGVYYLRTKSRRIAAVFKPSDEEPYAPNNPKRYLNPPQHQKKTKHEPESTSPRPEDQHKSHCDLSISLQSGIRVGITAGDAAIRDVAAYFLDKHRHAGVPLTVLAAASHPAFHYSTSLARERKIGALQTYIPHKCTADDVSSSLFSVDDVHAIALLDIRLANQDRHGGNILVVEQAKRQYKLVPIDHGACLPRVSEMEETSFLWLTWPQAKRPFSSDILQYIASLDPFEECRLLQQALPRGHQLETQALLTLLVCTVFLQVCALEKGMTAFEIGMLMCRHGSFSQQQPQPSVLELLVTKTLDDLGMQLDRELDFKAVVQSFERHLNGFLTN